MTLKTIPPTEKTPFNSPRLPSETPYWLRNGLDDHAANQSNENEHRRRMGMEPSGPPSV